MNLLQITLTKSRIIYRLNYKNKLKYSKLAS
jgi:hypothetical protein